jgi:hypothetical protein
MVKDLIVSVDQEDAKMGVFKKPKPGRNSIFDKNMPGRTHKLYRDLMLAANPGFVSRRTFARSPNRTKMFHVKHFGTIGTRPSHAQMDC